MPVHILGSATRPPATLDVTFTAHGMTGARLDVRFSVLPTQPATLDVGFSAYPLLDPAPGQIRTLSHPVFLTGLPPGEILSWSYHHSGTYEELDVTVSGLHGLAEPSALLRVVTRLNGQEYSRLPDRAFQAQGQEPQVDEARARTTFRFRNSFDRQLRGETLPELISWRLTPPPAECVTARRTVSISPFVVNLFQERVDPYFRIEGVDRLVGSTWEETWREYSTLGKTMQQVWDDTFGALGMVLQVRPRGTGIRLVGCWPNPHHAQAGAVVGPDLMLSRNPQRQSLRTPARLTLRGGDHVTELTPARFLSWVGADEPAYQEIARQVLPEGEYIDPPTGSGAARTQRGWRRTIGQLVSEILISTDDVDVQETVDGKLQIKNYRGLAVGYSKTVITLDPDCPTRPLMKKTETMSWGYAVDTKLKTFSTAGPGLYWNLTVGDLTAHEETITTYTYSPQGHESSNTESSTVLASVQQKDAELPPGERGPVEGREYVRLVKRTSRIPNGAGKWQRSTLPVRQKLVPLYDVDTGEAIRMQLVTGTTPMPTEVSDEAPPSFDCNLCPKEVRDPTGVVLSAGDVGHAEPREVTLDFLRPEDLIPVARAMLTNEWPRIVTTLTVAAALPYHPGTWVNGALVQDLTIEQAENDPRVTSTLTTAELDTHVLSPHQVGVYDLELPQNEGRAIMLAGRGSGARVRLVKGWKAQAGQPDVEDAFVAFRTGSPPQPMDEIDWVRYGGRLEARSAR